MYIGPSKVNGQRFSPTRCKSKSVWNALWKKERDIICTQKSWSNNWKTHPHLMSRKVVCYGNWIVSLVTWMKWNKQREETYGQRWIEGNELALENANANRQNHVTCFVDATILRHYRNAVSRVLQLPNNLPQIKHGIIFINVLTVNKIK